MTKGMGVEEAQVYANEVCKAYGHLPGYTFNLYRDAFLAGASWQREQMRWIPVGERLPVDNDAYVVLFPDAGELVRDVCVFHNGEWDLNTCYGNTVSHWLEGLPADPSPAPESEGE